MEIDKAWQLHLREFTESAQHLRLDEEIISASPLLSMVLKEFLVFFCRLEKLRWG